MRLRRFNYGDSNMFCRKIVCFLLQPKHYVVLSVTLKMYIKRKIKMNKMHQAFRFENGNARRLH